MESGSQFSEVDRALAPWRRQLLPFMVGSLVFMGFLFFAATLWNYYELQEQLKFHTADIRKLLQELEQVEASKDNPSYRDWYVRVVLEEAALKHRYQQTSALIQSRVWTRSMGFLTGMVLALSGCVFILGQMREVVKASMESKGVRGVFETSSPGLALALAGAVLIGISLYVKVSVDTSDSPVYLTRFIEVSGPSGVAQAPIKRPPAPMPPADAQPKQTMSPAAILGRKKATQVSDSPDEADCNCP